MFMHVSKNKITKSAAINRENIGFKDIYLISQNAKKHNAFRRF